VGGAVAAAAATPSGQCNSHYGRQGSPSERGLGEGTPGAQGAKFQARRTLNRRRGRRRPLPLPRSSLPKSLFALWSVTRVSRQGLLFFGRGSGHIASPAQRERPPTEGRRVRAIAHVAQTPCSKPCLPSPGALRAPASPRCAGRGNMAPGPSRVLSSLRVGVHFLHSYGCSRCGVGGLSRNLGNDERGSGRGRRRPRRRVRVTWPAQESAAPLSLALSPLSRGEGIGPCPGVATPGFPGRVKPFGALAAGGSRGRERVRGRYAEDGARIAGPHATAHAG
jgi:hypothetical protein